MKTKIPGLLAVGLLAGPVAVSAAPVTYYATGTFSDGGTLTGQFDFDVSAANLPSNINLVTTPGSILGGTTYTSPNDIYFNGNPVAVSGVSFLSNGVELRLFFYPYGLPGSGPWSLEAAELANSATTNRFTGRFDGIISTTPPSVPEPGTLALLGLGLAGLGLSRRRKAN